MTVNFPCRIPKTDKYGIDYFYYTSIAKKRELLFPLQETINTNADF
jgi:hypothetical protein